MLDVLFSDDYFTAINKPPGMLVHRTSIAHDNEPVALQLLRNQLGRMIYPVHRIDRPTSGVLLFAHTPLMTCYLQETLKSDLSSKIYTALVRGWMPDEVITEREVKNDKGKLQSAKTLFKNLRHFELPIATDRYSTARFSIIQAFPQTGRWHQIRQHLAQLRHYIINDRVHGDGKQNLIFTDQIGVREMFLHATFLHFIHPVTNKSLHIEASFPFHWVNDYIPKLETCKKMSF